MKKNLFLPVFVLLAHLSFPQAIKVVDPRCNNQIEPLGIETASPHLSWKLQSAGFNIVQTAYRVLVSNDSVALTKNTGNIWDSKKTVSSRSIQVIYNGDNLVSGKIYYWKVMVWDNKGNVSAWSKIASWQMGLLKPADWGGATWIGYQAMADSDKILPALPVQGKKKHKAGTDILPILRKEFVVSKPVKNATMFISGLGHFELSLNGKKVGDHFLDAGWVNYQKQALYIGFNLTGTLKQGKNALGVLLGNGFYFTPGGRYLKLTVAYGYPKLKCRLAIEYQDGSTENIVSDPSWKATPGPITFSSIYGGEDYNATLDQDGWDKPGFNDESWKNALIVGGPEQLNIQSAQPLKIFNEFQPQKVSRPKPGTWVYDLGQNASGIPQITVKGKRGDTIKIIPSELLLADGTANQNATGKWHYYNYILKGSGEETWQPRFTYYGFRYLQVQGAMPQNEANPGNLPQIIAIKGLHTRNAAQQVGSFTCSNTLFNQTNTLIDWAIQSNMSSVLTDCPHREKLGWLEEDHLVGNSIQYNYDISKLCQKIINDMRFAQTADGLIPEIAPEFTVFSDGFRDSPEWGSNCILLPWYVYQWYGDEDVLTGSYAMMQRYLAYLYQIADHDILSQGLGDWYDIGPNRPGVSQLTPKGITATAFFYYDLCTIAKIARKLGKQTDAINYEQKAIEVKKAFNDKFYNTDTKYYGSGSQTANAIAIYMKLVDPANKAFVVDQIVKDLRNRNNSLTAGDIGFRYLLKVLDEAGRSDVIFDMNSRLDVPGYGYQLAKGATALTESWQAYPSVSNNHFMLGHIMEWFYGGLAGITEDDDAVAYNKIVIRPQPVGDVKFAKGSFQSVYGLIVSEWTMHEKQFDLTINIPPNTTAKVYLPVPANAKIYINDQPKTVFEKIGKAVVINEGSGIYHFKAIF